MGTLVKKEVYTTAQPDGTLVTTTTKTKTTTTTDAEMGIGFGSSSMNLHYCCNPGGILRILQIICGLVIIAFITSVYGTGPFKGILFGQTFLLIITGIAICLTCIILVALFLSLHNTHLSFWPWRTFCLTFSVVAACIFVVGGFCEAYYASGAWANNCNEIGGDGIVHNGCRTIIEWGFASAFCFILAILYFISAFFAYKDKFFD